MTPPLKRTNTTRRDEELLQNAVVQYFAIALPDDVIFWHTPNGGRRSPSEGARFKRMGVKPGIPDLFLLHCGNLCAIELKTKNGRTEVAQKDMHALLKGQGCPVATCRSIEDVEAFLAPRMTLKASTGVTVTVRAMEEFTEQANHAPGSSVTNSET